MWNIFCNTACTRGGTWRDNGGEKEDRGQRLLNERSCELFAIRSAWLAQ